MEFKPTCKGNQFGFLAVPVIICIDFVVNIPWMAFVNNRIYNNIYSN
jgi:hypothetical protein